MSKLGRLGDQALLASLHSLVGSHRRVTSDIVAHLGEMDRRRLHVALGFSSLFEYCLEELKFSEDEAYRRIEVARLARRFPALLTALGEGKASVSALALLKTHLNEANCAELLALVSDVTVRGAKERLAARFPMPPVPDGVRKLPPPEARGREPPVVPTKTNPVAAASLPVDAPATGATLEVPQHIAPSGPSPSPRPTVEPVAEDRFLVKITVTRAVRDKLELARDLMRHRQPDGRLDAILEAALDTLLERLEREKFGRAKRPRGKRPSSARTNESAKRAPCVLSRNVPRSSKREAVARDGMRCAFVSEDGRRCEACAFLEFDHVTPVGKGGGPEAFNIRVLCRAHNRLMAERAYGRPHVDAAIAEARRGRTKPPAQQAIDEHDDRSRSGIDPRHRG